MPHTTPPRTAAVSVPDPSAGDCLPMPPQETLRQSQAGLAQSLMGITVPFPAS